jgi:hypothetical protein
MVLLKVNLPRLSVAPFKGDAPGAVDVQAVAPRLAPERMEIEPRNVEVAQRRGLRQGVESAQGSFVEVRRHLPALALTKKLVESLVAEAPYHRASVTFRVTGVNCRVTARRSAEDAGGAPVDFTRAASHPSY